MEIKVRMMMAQTFAVNEEKRAGGARLAAKQVSVDCRVLPVLHTHTICCCLFVSHCIDCS